MTSSIDFSKLDIPAPRRPRPRPEPIISPAPPAKNTSKTEERILKRLESDGPQTSKQLLSLLYEPVKEALDSLQLKGKVVNDPDTRRWSLRRKKKSLPAAMEQMRSNGVEPEYASIESRPEMSQWPGDSPPPLAHIPGSPNPFFPEMIEQEEENKERDPEFEGFEKSVRRVIE
jgi:hypothetical protein